MIDESSKSARKELNVTSGTQFPALPLINSVLDPAHTVTLVTLFFLHLSDEIGT